MPILISLDKDKKPAIRFTLGLGEEADIKYWQNASDEERVYNMLYLQQFMLEFFYPGTRRIEKVVTIKKIREKE